VPPVEQPLTRAHPGCLSVRIRKPADGQPDVFAITSLWKDLASLQAFVGENWREATIPPGEADLLEEIVVQHNDEPHLSTVDTWHAVAEVVRAREAAAMTASLTDAQCERIRPLLPPARKMDAPAPMTGAPSTISCTSCAPGVAGMTCRRSSGATSPVGGASSSARPMALGSAPARALLKPGRWRIA
jgi:quinol monooxygenase YgiN